MASYKYMELASWIRQNIESKTYKNGMQIPTEMELASLFSVSRDTVRQGILKLEEEGLLTRIKGSGTYVNAPSYLFDKKLKRIGVLMNDLDNYIFPSIMRGINGLISKKGYSIDMRFTSNQISLEESLLNSLVAGGIDGLIVEPAKAALPILNFSLYEKIAAQIPTVLIHAHYPIPNISCITTGNTKGSYEITKYLIEKGHQNIAILCKFDEQTGTERYLGYLKALKDYGVPIIDSNICWFASELTTTLFTDSNDNRLYSSIVNATAIICHDDRVAIQLINYLKNKKIRVPEDVSVTGFDNAEMSQNFNLTTIDHPKEEYGRFVAEKLLEKMEDPSKDVSYTFTPKLIERGTVSTLTPL